MVDSKQQWKAWLYLSPAIILLLIFTVWPIINTLKMAFLNGFSVAKSNKIYSVGDNITLYGKFTYDADSGYAMLDSSSYFTDKDALFSNDTASENALKASQKDLISRIKALDEGEALDAYEGLQVDITEIKKEYDVNTLRMSFYAEAKVGTVKLKVICKKCKHLDYEFDFNSSIYITGDVVKTSSTGVKYTITEGTYNVDTDLTKAKRDAIAANQDSNIDVIEALSLNETATNKTFYGSVYSIDSIDSDNNITITVQVIDSESHPYFIKCKKLIASEQGGLIMSGFHFGIKNFQKVVNYAQFGTCLKNTLLICVLTVPLSTLLALFISVCLNSIKAFQKLLQTIYFLPYVTNSIAIGMVFATMFNMVGYQPGVEPATIGVVNNVIEFFGGTRINWMNAGSTYGANIAVMVIYIVWNALPFKILILLGGLQSVNKQYYDAAKIDGTSKWRTFWRITVPLLSPMIAYVVITGFIGGFKEYTSIVGVFGESMGPAGDPVAGGSLNTMVGYIYKAIQNDQGIASAASLILFAIILVVTLINLKVSSKRVHY